MSKFQSDEKKNLSNPNQAKLLPSQYRRSFAQPTKEAPPSKQDLKKPLHKTGSASYIFLPLCSSVLLLISSISVEASVDGCLCGNNCKVLFDPF
jgi:hypothetical protein